MSHLEKLMSIINRATAARTGLVQARSLGTIDEDEANRSIALIDEVMGA